MWRRFSSGPLAAFPGTAEAAVATSEVFHLGRFADSPVAA